jgi:hypothetical protein
MNVLSLVALKLLSPSRQIASPPPPMPAIAPLHCVPAVDAMIRLPAIDLPAVVLQPLPKIPNPALILNIARPTVNDINGLGPALQVAPRRFDIPVCMDPTHEHNNKRKNRYPVMSSCRSCLKQAVESIPAYATHWQAVRFLTAWCRCYFCPFCMLECDDPNRMHMVTAKSTCKKHSVINSVAKCKHNKQWTYCKECPEDPRSATYYCACGLKTSGNVKCMCPAGKRVSYGIRVHTNPFVVPTDAVRAQEDAWAADKMAYAARVQANPSEVEPTPKRRRINTGKVLGPYVAPYV